MDQTLAAIGVRGSARIFPATPELLLARPMTRREKLDFWARLLEHDPDQRLKALSRVEFEERDVQLTMRHDHSPIAVAYRNKILREQGLAGDTLGDATKFFELSRREAHHIACDCHYLGSYPKATEFAAHIRSCQHTRLGEFVRKIAHCLSGTGTPAAA